MVFVWNVRGRIKNEKLKMKTLNILLATPQTDNTSIIIGGSVLLLALGVMYYFNGKKKK